MSAPQGPYQVFSERALQVDLLAGSMTVKVASGDTVYYADNPYVNSTTNQGSIANGASQTFTTGVWVRSASLSSITVQQLLSPGQDIVLGSDGAVGGPGGTALTSSVASVSSPVAKPEATTLGANYTGGTALTLAQALNVPLRSYIAVDVGTPTCEIAQVGAASSGTGVTLLAAFSYTHNAGAQVVVFNDGDVPASWFGVVGDNSADDTAAWQQAVRACAALSLWVSGRSRSSKLSAPVICPTETRIRRATFNAAAGFAPADANNAMLMTQAATIQIFTATSGVLTTPSAHTMVNGSLVMLKGTVSGGAVAGRLYWATNVTATTFQLASTYANSQSGTADVAIADGSSGTAYPKVLSMARFYTDQVYVNAASVASVNCVAMNIQQQSYHRRLRCDGTSTAGSFGLYLSGQQCIFENFESIGCDTGVVFDNAQFMWFYGYDVEQFYTQADHIVTSAQSLYHFGGGAFSNAFYGCHHEYNHTPSQVHNHEGSHGEIVYDTIELSWSPASGAFVYSHVGDAAASGYEIRNLHLSSVPSSTGFKIVNDTDRGFSLDGLDDFHQSWPQLISVRRGTSSYLYGSPGQLFIGDSGGWFGVSRQGHPMLNTSAVPDPSNISNGQVMWYVDPTAGAMKVIFKGKDAGGTVRTATVNLA